MISTDEEIIKFPFNKEQNEYNLQDYAPRSTNSRVPAKRVKQIGMRVNKIIKTNEQAERIYQHILVFLPVVWVLLGFALVYAFHRKRNSEPYRISLFEINSYIVLFTGSFLLHFYIIRAFNQSIDKKYRLIQNFLMERNQFLMKTGYRWNIEPPEISNFDVVPPKRLYFRNLEICKDYWTMDDFTLVDDDQENTIKFPFHERKDQFIYQFYTPRLTNFRLSLHDLNKFFAKIEEVLQSDSKGVLSSRTYIKNSPIVLILLIVNFIILVLLKSKQQGDFEFWTLIVSFVIYCLSLRIAANKVNINTRKTHKKIQDILTLENGSRDIKGISWRIGDLVFQKKDPLTRGVLLFDSLDLIKEYDQDEQIFQDEAFNQEDPSFEKDDEEDKSQSINMNNSISGYFLNQE